ncbi:hypothetical protein TorRG33x02_174490 [Trema orientale]|uniref:Uncharacterized protein n=1 Tax=Trema orientale TaxID=63057 RepID=A0A2P5EMM5_TREOI|nr:hypothetical protein TorRG33x02_174490 [Trema orientale]
MEVVLSIASNVPQIGPRLGFDKSLNLIISNQALAHNPAEHPYAPLKDSSPFTFGATQDSEGPKTVERKNIKKIARNKYKVDGSGDLRRDVKLLLKEKFLELKSHMEMIW